MKDFIEGFVGMGCLMLLIVMMVGKEDSRH